MSERHFYYLHTNGDLIHKPAIVVDSDPQYFDSPFVRRVWTVDPEERGSAYIMLVEAAALGANMKRVLELAKKWSMDGDDGYMFCDRAGFVLSEAGSEVEVRHKDDDASRTPGIGSTPLLALISYTRAGDFAKAGS